MSELQFALRNPHLEGTDFETGCHTWNGNDFILYHQSTPATIANLEARFKACLKYMKSRRFLHCGAVLAVKPTDKFCRFAGPVALNDAFDTFSRYLDSFFDFFVRCYEKEIGPVDWQDEKELVKKDIFNFFFREFEFWIPSHLTS
jgi:hypothetical protein